jgi:hypothetical protein
MRSLKIPLAGVAALAVMLGLIAAVGPAAGASNLLRAAPGCPAGTIKGTSISEAGYGACDVKEAFDQVSATTSIPQIPVCNECALRFAVGMGNQSTAPDSTHSTARASAAVHPIGMAGVGVNKGIGIKPVYYAWYQVMGNYTQVSSTSLAVSKSDSVTVTVSQNNNAYTFAFTDNTTGQSYTSPMPTPCPNCVTTSAEWVVQAVPHGSGFYPLLKKGHWKVAKATWQDAGGASGNLGVLPHVAILMIRNNQALATPSPLLNAGSQFVVSWKRGA